MNQDSPTDLLIVQQRIAAQRQLQAFEEELKELDTRLAELQARRRQLLEDRDRFSSLISTDAPENPTDFSSKTAFKWSKRMNLLAEKYWKITNYRPYQLEVMNSTLSGRDCLAILSTGSGKSLCFQLPALLSEGLTVVISPLLSLVLDQFLDLTERGIPVLSLTGQATKDETKQAFDNLRASWLPTSSNALAPHEKIRLLYVTPEKVVKNKRLLSLLESLYRAGRLARIVIDEAHCCSQYGHDFRPDYKKLGILKMQFSQTPILALTATCPASLRPSVLEILQLKEDQILIYTGNLNRPNLNYFVTSKPSGQQETVEYIVNWIQERHRGQKGIIYCLTRKDSEIVAEAVMNASQNQIRCATYHADINDEQKRHIHRQWRTNEISVVVATIAFGMGINSPNVRFVIHHTMSKSLEAYFQESGRAGRDQEQADCLLMYRGQDALRITALVYGESDGIRNVHGMLRYCNSVSVCRRQLFTKYFGVEPVECNQGCDVCRRPRSDFTKIDITDYAVTISKIVKLLRSDYNEKVTLTKLVDILRGRTSQLKNKAAMQELKSQPGIRFPLTDQSTEDQERIVVQLILENVLKEEYHFTAYNTINYLDVGVEGKAILRALDKGTSYHNASDLTIDVTVTGTGSKLVSDKPKPWVKRNASVGKENAIKKPKIAINSQATVPPSDVIDLTVDDGPEVGCCEMAAPGDEHDADDYELERFLRAHVDLPDNEYEQEDSTNNRKSENKDDDWEFDM